ncbi:MAG: hypothetical protein ACRDBG_13635, partial [Waterburya sp.]
VQAEYNIAGTSSTLNSKYATSDYSTGTVSIKDVVEGEQYKIRLRYISSDGRVGLWSAYTHHSVVGKKSQPGKVIGFNAVADKFTNKIKLSWQLASEPDIRGYEIRTDINFGNSVGRIFFGESSDTLVDAILIGQTRTYYICAIDYSDNYSNEIVSTTYTPQSLPEVLEVTHNFADDSLTSATINLSFKVPDTEYSVSRYEISYDGTSRLVDSNTVVLPANWLGNRAFTIKVIDSLGNKSSGFVYNVTKLPPNPLIGFRSQVIDNSVMLFWTLPARTSLPTDHVLLKKGNTWETANKIGEIKTEFTVIDELESGNFTYWGAVVDTDGNQSTPVSLSAQVSEPPDFKFFAEFTSTFNGIKSNALSESAGVVLPVNLTETYDQHFASRSWLSPQAQIS